MQNIIIIFAFLFSCINFSVFVNRLIIKIPELKDTDYWLNLITLGILINFFVIWLLGIYSLTAHFFFYIYFFFNIIFLILNKKNNNYQSIKNLIFFFLEDCKIYKYFYIFLLIVLLCYFLNGFAPPTDIDSLNYHLTLPKKDIEFGKIITHGWNESEYMPMLIEHLMRFLLLFGTETIGHQLNFFIFILCLVGIYRISINLNLNKKIGLLALLFFALIKGNMWLVTTTHNELILTFFLIITVNNYLLFKKNPSNYYAIQIALSCAALLYIKYHAIIFIFAFFLIISKDLFIKKIKLKKIYFLYFFIPLFLFSPLLIRNFFLVGDPLYPLFYFYNAIGGTKEYGIDTSLLSFFTTPIYFSLFGNVHFDGQYLGAPYFVFLIYSCLFFTKKIKIFSDILIISIVYYLVWFYGLSQQVRYLIPILAIVSVFCSFIFFEIYYLFRSSFLKKILVFFFIIFLINQFIFLIGYNVIKFPAAMGIVSKDKYLNSEGSDYSFNRSCSFLNKNLINKNYISISIYLPFYCPQKQSLRVENRNFFNKKNISENEIKQYIKEKNIKYIFIQTRDRKITKTGYDFQTVNVNEPNLKTLLTLSKKEVFKDNQSIIYELIF
jgi:hypothetical protein